MLKVKAHAKINLALKVLGKREDGYHEVEMVMQSLALHDKIFLTLIRSDIELLVEGDAPLDESNLAYKAAKAILEYSNCKQGIRIKLVKNIPAAAGLAGGSSDAAAVLLGINKLLKLGLDTEELMEIGKGLGSDVPFCIVGGTALARGRGEKIQPLPKAPKMGVVLIKPDFGVSTAQVYKRFSLDLVEKKADVNAVVEAIKKGDIKGIATAIFNDLEYVTMDMHPCLEGIKRQLEDAGALGVLMSGSGPTVYGLAFDLGHANMLAKRLDIDNVRVIVTSTA
ncbi:4-(cytidine 5'-diphospho)-2-C-methyl-D-erythritol kinase [Peptococcaceae bacterium]|nr:4-(cytidine 5'-diphospho)-2-C-methyl-D-erythritol kinase [Peptococcaceae bacterium]MCL0052554.1 4-(cytidine 5'-diphospho)-2-C-methyl-D-erythritol kinase [Peptococcaceae bacterium]